MINNKKYIFFVSDLVKSIELFNIRNIQLLKNFISSFSASIV